MMSQHAMVTTLLSGLFLLSGCATTYHVTAENIHEVPITSMVREVEVGEISAREGFMLRELHFILRSEGVLDEIESVWMGASQFEPRVNFLEPNLTAYQIMVDPNHISNRELTVIISPTPSIFVRRRSVIIPLQLIHDTAQTNISVSDFLGGVEKGFPMFDEIQ